MQRNHTINILRFGLLAPWRRLCMRLRRECSVVALLLLLTLGVGEPLLCILHCSFSMSGMAHHGAAAQSHDQHQHHQHHGSHADQVRVEAPADPSNCALGIPMLPVPAQPVPVHELAPTLAFLLPVPLHVVRLQAAPLGDPLAIFHAPLLRPPIA